MAIMHAGNKLIAVEDSLAWPPVWLDMAATRARAVPVAAAFCGSRTSATAAVESTTLLPFLAAAASPAQMSSRRLSLGRCRLQAHIIDSRQAMAVAL